MSIPYTPHKSPSPAPAKFGHFGLIVFSSAAIRASSAAMREVLVTANTVNMMPLKTMGTPIARYTWTLSISAMSIPYTPHKSPSPAPAKFGHFGHHRSGGRRASLPVSGGNPWPLGKLSPQADA